MAEAASEAEKIKAGGGGYYYRDYKSGRIPDVRAGDRVYYVEDGYVRGFCLVERVVYGGNDERVARVYMDATTWKWIKPIMVAPREVVRSYMYAENFKLYAPLGHGLSRGDVEIVGGWLDPKPEVAP